MGAALVAVQQAVQDVDFIVAHRSGLRQLALLRLVGGVVRSVDSPAELIVAVVVAAFLTQPFTQVVQMRDVGLSVGIEAPGDLGVAVAAALTQVALGALPSRRRRKSSGRTMRSKRRVLR